MMRDAGAPPATRRAGERGVIGSIVIATAAAMFQRILQTAVEIQSENDLTV